MKGGGKMKRNKMLLLIVAAFPCAIAAHAQVVPATPAFANKIARLQKQIEALTAGLQTVSAQLELGKSALQTVVSNQ
jgi:hypothetical protein